MHGADGGSVGGCLHLLVEDCERQAGAFGGGTGPGNLVFGADEDADCAWVLCSAARSRSQ